MKRLVQISNEDDYIQYYPKGYKIHSSLVPQTLDGDIVDFGGAAVRGEASEWGGDSSALVDQAWGGDSDEAGLGTVPRVRVGEESDKEVTTGTIGLAPQTP